jgi:hypothetical protein
VAISVEKCRIRQAIRKVTGKRAHHEPSPNRYSRDARVPLIITLRGHRDINRCFSLRDTSLPAPSPAPRSVPTSCVHAAQRCAPSDRTLHRGSPLSQPPSRVGRTTRCLLAARHTATNRFIWRLENSAAIACRDLSATAIYPSTKLDTLHPVPEALAA